MTPEDLDAALSAPPRPQRQPLSPSPARPISEAFGCSDQHARTLADHHGLIDDEGILHCWNCRGRCHWHVSLHCDPCRERSIREAPERRFQARQAEIERQNLELQRSAPRVANGRAFR